MSRSSDFLSFLVFGLILTMSISGFAQEEPESDRGSADPVLNAKQWLQNELANGSSLLTPTQRISLLKRYEVEVRKELRAKSVVQQQQELMELANRYWEERAFTEADGMYREVIGLAPKSLDAAGAYKMMGWIQYGNMMKPAAAITPLEQSFKILQELDLPEDESIRKNLMAAQVASTLGDIYLLEKQETKAEELYRLLLDNKELSSAADLNIRINANAEMARMLTRQERYEEALERYSEARELVEESDLPSEMRLAFSLEFLSAKSLGGASTQEMIGFLEDLWSKRVEQTNDLNTLKLGSYLVLFYFFSSEEKQRKKLPDFLEQYFEIAKDVWESEGEQLKKVPRDRQDYYSLIQQARLLMLEYAQAEKNGRIREKALGEFLDGMQEFKLPFRAWVPSQFPSQYALKIMELFDARIKPELKSRGLDKVEKSKEAGVEGGSSEPARPNGKTTGNGN